MKKRTKIIIGVSVLAVVASAFLIINIKPIPVTETPILQREVKVTVSASGTVVSQNDANLSFATLGRLAQLNVVEGDKVVEGTFLASLDSFPESQMVQSYKDARDIAIRDRDLFQENYSKDVDEVGGQDEYEIQLRRYNEYLSKAEASYQSQVGSLGRRYMYAPFAGTIIDIYKDKGETALAGETLIKIADMSKLLFEIEINQDEFGYLKVGQEVEITLDAYPNEEFIGVVNELPEYVGSAGGKDFVIKIEFSGDNKEKALLGMTGDAFIVLAKTQGEVSALTYDEIQYDIEDNPFLYVLHEGMIKKLDIEVGMEGDIFTEIKTPVNDPVVKSITDKVELKEGLKAKIRK